MSGARLIGYVLLAALIAFVFASTDRIRYEWAQTTEENKVFFVLTTAILGTIVAAWALWPLAKHFM